MLMMLIAYADADADAIVDADTNDGERISTSQEASLRQNQNLGLIDMWQKNVNLS